MLIHHNVSSFLVVYHHSHLRRDNLGYIIIYLVKKRKPRRKDAKERKPKASTLVGIPPLKILRARQTDRKTEKF